MIACLEELFIFKKILKKALLILKAFDYLMSYSLKQKECKFIIVLKIKISDNTLIKKYICFYLNKLH